MVTVAGCSPTLPAISKTFNNKIITPQGPFIQRRVWTLSVIHISDSNSCVDTGQSGGRGPGDNVRTLPSSPGSGGRGETPGTRVMSGDTGDWSQYSET